MSNQMDSLESRRLFAVSWTAANVTTQYANDLRFENGRFEIADQSRPTVVSTFKVSKTGTLFISGTGKADNISLKVRDGKIVGDPNIAIRFTAKAGELVSFGGNSGNVVHYTTTTNGDGTASILARQSVTGLRDIKRIDVSGLGGDDVINVNADVPVNVSGARGNDRITVYANNRTVAGGSGTDTIVSEDFDAAPLFELIRFDDFSTTFVPTTTVTRILK